MNNRQAELTARLNLFMRALDPELAPVVRYDMDLSRRFDDGSGAVYIGNAQGDGFIATFKLEAGDTPLFKFRYGMYMHLNEQVRYSRQNVLKLEALRVLMETERDTKVLPEVGEAWQHYKGKVYRVTSLGRHSGTGEHMVGYEALDDLSTHYRPLYDTPIASDQAWTRRMPDGTARFTYITQDAVTEWLENLPAPGRPSNVESLQTEWR